MTTRERYLEEILHKAPPLTDWQRSIIEQIFVDELYPDRAQQRWAREEAMRMDRERRRQERRQRLAPALSHLNNEDIYKLIGKPVYLDNLNCYTLGTVHIEVGTRGTFRTCTLHDRGTGRPLDCRFSLADVFTGEAL